MGLGFTSKPKPTISLTKANNKKYVGKKENIEHNDI